MKTVLSWCLAIFCPSWGFYAHQEINELAVYTLPKEMIVFFKANISYLREVAVNPDRRRHSVPEEAPRHYIDLDHYGDSALQKLPRNWRDAVEKFSEDTLVAYGIVPWHINRMYYRLREAFLLRDPPAILKIAAELGHYVGDAHVPLHTTENYNGQQTGQDGIHGFWESRLPELFAGEYNFFVGRAEYVGDPMSVAWEAVRQSHEAVDSVLAFERRLTELSPDRKYSFESKGKATAKVYAVRFSQRYHHMLDGMVERRMCAAIHVIGNLWFSAWVDAGQPDLRELLRYKPTEAELEERRREIEQWRAGKLAARSHEGDLTHP